MAKWGNVDYRQFQELQKRMEKMQEAAKKEFFEAAAKELAARLLAKVIKRTPVGEYPKSSGKKGGTLRRGWTAGNKNWSEKNGKVSVHGIGGASGYVNNLPIHHFGNTYVIEIVNPVEYASYVEYGHRTRDHKGWVPGRFMLTISEQEIDAQKERILEKKLTKYLGELFND